MSLVLLFASFIAGVLTVAAPCVLPVLPILLGGSGAAAARGEKLLRPLVMIVGLLVSIFVFTLLLRVSTAFIVVPQWVWTSIAGITVLGFGLSYLFPDTWERLASWLRLNRGSQQLLQKAARKRSSPVAWFLLGAALGPVFNSCSPTYGLIVAAIIPVDFAVGILYLLAYCLGLGIALAIIAYVGRTAVHLFKEVVNPDGVFRKVLGVLLVVIGILVLAGLDRRLETWLLDRGWYSGFSAFELQLRDR